MYYGGIVVVHDKNYPEFNKQERYIVVSINLDLAELLIEMGYEERKDQDNYIIDPEEEFSREHIKNCLSNSFAHHIEPLGLKRNLSFECLRKTYATFSNQAGGEEFSMDVTKHTNKEVMIKQYWNKIEKGKNT